MVVMTNPNGQALFPALLFGKMKAAYQVFVPPGAKDFPSVLHVEAIIYLAPFPLLSNVPYPIIPKALQRVL